MSDRDKPRPDELLWETASLHVIVQLWRHGESRRLVLSSTEGTILLTTDERRNLGRLLLVEARGEQVQTECSEEAAG